MYRCTTLRQASAFTMQCLLSMLGDHLRFLCLSDPLEFASFQQQRAGALLPLYDFLHGHTEASDRSAHAPRLVAQFFTRLFFFFPALSRSPFFVGFCSVRGIRGGSLVPGLLRLSLTRQFSGRFPYRQVPMREEVEMSGHRP